ncbi:MAG: hypothetical protein ACFFE8_02905 [Candidatus Heimdallarchaeota archaeon]
MKTRRISSFTLLLLIVLFITSMWFKVIVPEELSAKKENLTNSPKALWNQSYGVTGGGDAPDLIQTNDGGFALAGSTGVGNAYGSEMWLVKTDDEGVVQWTHTYGGLAADWASALIQTTDGGYVLAGNTRSYGGGAGDMWLVKTNAIGVALWSQTYGGFETDEASALVQTADGGFAIAGFTSSFYLGGFDMMLVKTNSNGTEEWIQTFGGKQNQFINSDDYATALIQTTDGGFALAGYNVSFDQGSDMWLVKTDRNGNAIWNQSYGGRGGDEAYAVIQTLDGGFALVGVTGSFGAGGGDMWFVKTNADGVMQWSQTYGGTGSEWARTLIQTSDGGFAIAGLTGSFGNGGGDMWLVKTNVDGKILWSETYGGPESDWASAMLQTADGSFVLAGLTGSFGTSGRDMWLVKTIGGSDYNGPNTSPLLLVFVIILLLTISWYRNRK